MSHTDHYKVLQVDPEAEAEVVQAAYRRLARKYHPDVAESPEAVPPRHTAASEPPAQPPHRARPPEETSPNWTSGRSSAGSGYDPASMGTPAGHGAAGPPRGARAVRPGAPAGRPPPRGPPRGGAAVPPPPAPGGRGRTPPAATSSTWS